MSADHPVPPGASVERGRIEDLLARADLRQHVDRTLTVGIPRLDPKTREHVAGCIALKVRLALLTALAQREAEHA